MIIYHIFINGKPYLKTESFYYAYSFVKDYELMDVFASELIMNHQYHVIDTNTNKKIDILITTIG